MAREREVGTLWIGGALSWLEVLCLKSFVDRGQKITLFSYEPIPNVPEGVIRRDGREIMDVDNFMKHEQKDSFALFADLFRLHMIKQCPGMIWIDTDVYCLRPMDYDTDYVIGFELPGEHRANTAIMGLPADSDLLNAMLDFCADEYSIAPFLPPKLKQKYQDAAARGTPVHISEQPWGTWGPTMLTHFVHALGHQDKVMPLDAFYPITFRERTEFLKPVRVAESYITENTTALHLWASNKKQLGNRHHGLPPKGSYFAKLVEEHGVNAALAPIKSRAKTAFEGALLDEVEMNSVDIAADISGHARSFMLALYHKYYSQLHLINANAKGQLQQEDMPWIAEYISFLTDNGVERDAITVIRDEKDLRQVDIFCNLKGFGDQHKPKFLKPYLETCMHADSMLFMDIRQGSGAFPMLKKYGTNTQLSQQDVDGKTLTRIRFQCTPPSGGDPEWDRLAPKLAGPQGWYRPGDNGHSFIYVPRDSDTLVVTFDNLDIAMNKRDRRPWGYEFIENQGWSMLGVLAGGWTWYREPWVHDQFDQLRDTGFFKQFKRVVFYGASMGGYAACAFSPAAPGCDVVAISPQSTVDRSVVPFETRYKVVWDKDFSGPYGDAAQVSVAAGQVTILYDPYEPLDAQHAARFTNDNTRLLRAPFLGHRLGSSLSQMGVLSRVMLGALNGTLSDQDYAQILRSRRDFPRYQRELFLRALDKGHRKLAMQMGDKVLRMNPNRAVRLEMKALRNAT